MDLDQEIKNMLFNSAAFHSIRHSSNLIADRIEDLLSKDEYPLIPTVCALSTLIRTQLVRLIEQQEQDDGSIVLAEALLDTTLKDLKSVQKLIDELNADHQKKTYNCQTCGKQINSKLECYVDDESYKKLRMDDDSVTVYCSETCFDEYQV